MAENIFADLLAVTDSYVDFHMPQSAMNDSTRRNTIPLRIPTDVPALEPLDLVGGSRSERQTVFKTPPDPAPQNVKSSRRREGDAGVISRIEQCFADFAEQLYHNRDSLCISFDSRAARSHQVESAISDLGKTSSSPRQLYFPGETAQEAWRFTVLLRILELVHEALVNGVVTTKRLRLLNVISIIGRDIYYKDPALFLKQAVVDRYVDDVAYMFGVKRVQLNVAAAAKGLVAGCFMIKRIDGSIQDGTSEPEGILVPDLHDIDELDIAHSSWTLVIEKEATFRSLASTKFYSSQEVGSGIILTAKGYPDISTRSFLRQLSVSHPRHATPLPIYSLVDYDPDGIAIMANYKHGSIALAHENDQLNVPRVQWLGIKSSDFVQPVGSGTETALLQLTARDRRKAIMMLKQGISADDRTEDEWQREWQRELQVMLMLSVKAEIQLLCEGDGGLACWLTSKLKSG